MKPQSSLTQALIVQREYNQAMERVTQRPDRFEGSTISFDPDLSVDIVLYLEEYFEQLEDHQRENLKNICLGLMPFNHRQAFYPMTFFEFDPNLLLRIKEASTRLDIQPAATAGLFVWSFNQLWRKEINIVDVLSKWGETCIGNQNIKQNFINNALFLEQLLPLILHIPEKIRSAFMGNVLNTLFKYTAPWDDHKNQYALSAHYLMLLGKAAIHCRGHFTKKGHSIPHFWADKAARAMTKHWEDFENPNIFEDSKKAVLASTILMDSDIPRSDLTRAFMQTKSDIWCAPRVYELLKNELHAQENRRLFELPWCDMPQSYEINRATVQLYCPEIFQMLDLGTLPEQWQERKVIAKLMRRWSKPPMALTLPEGMNPE